MISGYVFKVIGASPPLVPTDPLPGRSFGDGGSSTRLVDDHEGGWACLPDAVVWPQDSLGAADLDISGHGPNLWRQHDGENCMRPSAGGRVPACGDARQQGCLYRSADPAPADEDGI